MAVEQSAQLANKVDKIENVCIDLSERITELSMIVKDLSRGKDAQLPIFEMNTPIQQPQASTEPAGDNISWAEQTPTTQPVVETCKPDEKAQSVESTPIAQPVFGIGKPMQTSPQADTSCKPVQTSPQADLPSSLNINEPMYRGNESAEARQGMATQRISHQSRVHHNRDLCRLWDFRDVSKA